MHLTVVPPESVVAEHARPAPETASSAAAAHPWLFRILPGLGLVAVIAVVAGAIGARIPVVGGPVLAVAIGMVVATLRPMHASMRTGISFASTYGLQAAIVLLGMGLSLTQVATTGSASVWVMLGTLTIALSGAYVFSRILKVPGDVATLIGVGTAICGASAIAATASVTRPHERDVAYAISTIFLFNVVAVLVDPLLGHLMHLTQHSFGLWAGTAINDMSSVVAAGYTYGPSAGAYAVIVKLARSTAILPISLALLVWRTWRGRKGGAATTGRERSFWRAFPWFIVWFLLASLAHTLGLVPPAVDRLAAPLGMAMIVVALAAIGLSARVREMAATGPRPLLLGFFLWVTVGAASLVLQHATGTL